MFPAVEAAAARRKVVRGPRVHVTVRTGFPIRRTLPQVVVRPAPVIRVAPRVYLQPVVFGGAVVASLPSARVWSDGEELDREDGWTDFTMNVDKRGSGLVMQIEDGVVQINFAEIVFDNGDAQVVDFNDKVHRKGVYSLRFQRRSQSGSHQSRRESSERVRGDHASPRLVTRPRPPFLVTLLQP